MRFPTMWYVRPQKLRPACTYAQSHQSLCLSVEYCMIVKLLTERLFDFLSLKGGCIGSFESTHVKMPHCWKSHVAAHFSYANSLSYKLSPTQAYSPKHYLHVYNHLARRSLSNSLFTISQPYPHFEPTYSPTYSFPYINCPSCSHWTFAPPPPPESLYLTHL